jgi:hypothetical protein
LTHYLPTMDALPASETSIKFLCLLGSSARRSDRAAWRLDLRRPGQPDSGRVAVGVRTQDPQVRLHPEGVRAAARHDQSVTRTCRRRRGPPQWTKGVSSVILQHGAPGRRPLVLSYSLTFLLSRSPPLSAC